MSRALSEKVRRVLGAKETARAEISLSGTAGEVVIRAEWCPVERGRGHQAPRKKGLIRIHSSVRHCLRWIPERSLIALKSREQFKVLNENKTSSVEEGNTYACQMQWALATYSPNGWDLIPLPPTNSPSVARIKSMIQINRWASLLQD